MYSKKRLKYKKHFDSLDSNLENVVVEATVHVSKISAAESFLQSDHLARHFELMEADGWCVAARTRPRQTTAEALAALYSVPTQVFVQLTY